MGIPGLSRVDASQIRALIERLQELLSQKDPEASDFRSNQGCYGNGQQEFQSIVDQIRSLTDQTESRKFGLRGNGDSGNGRLNIRITA